MNDLLMLLLRIETGEDTYLIVALTTEHGVHLGLVLGRKRKELGGDERGLRLVGRLEQDVGLKVAAQDGRAEVRVDCGD